MGFQKRQLLVLLLGVMLELVQAANFPHPICGDNGNYAHNSTYEMNLLSVFSSLSSHIQNNGFYSGSFGMDSNQITFSAICNAGLQLEDCRNCIDNATIEIQEKCPFRIDAILYREFCTLRYSNEAFLGTRTSESWHKFSFMSWLTVASVEQFNTNLTQLLHELILEASVGGPLLKVAAGNHSGPIDTTIFAMLQCTPDLSAEDCKQCLVIGEQDLITTNGTQGVRVLYPSCWLRYEIYTFFNFTRIQQVEPLFSPPRQPPTSTPSPLSFAPPPPGSSRRIIIIISVVVAVVVACAFLGVCAFLILSRRKREENATKRDDDDVISVESIQYDFEQIKTSTNDFSEANELGRGGFGTVYKGMLNGQEIAVKRLSKRSSQGDLEFKNEVIVLVKVQHRNLVRLLGFATQGIERLLIYEFLNGSLESIIFDPVKRAILDWGKRYKIISGIAKGLLYLHEDSCFRIIHRDLKPSNILLDVEMNPKISDFGLARLFAADESKANTSRIFGTYGYMAPEYAYHGQFSVKIDVFSFGILILEIISGQKNNTFVYDGILEDMLNFAWRSWHEGASEKMIDPILRASSTSLQDMLRCIHIGLLCVQENASRRPNMTSIIQMLNNSSITIPLPSQPAYFSNVSNSSTMGFSKSSGGEDEQALRKEASVNEITMSELNPL